MARWTQLTSAAALLLVAACSAPPPPTMTGQTSLGPVLTNDKGMTLYTFARDSGGKSACNGQCAVNWPPLLSDDSRMASGNYTLITRDDGKMQWAYMGKPLYTWAKDTKPGETTGEGMLDGAWHVAKP